MNIDFQKKARIWGRLLRTPNLFTVPGDVIAGALWAGTSAFSLDMIWACAGILCVYSAGLLFNDYFDREDDARERPGRPIPSGDISARTVYVSAWIFLGAGNSMVLAGAGIEPAFASILVSVCVLLYDAGLKKNRAAGPVLMGLCRGGSVITGALAAGGFHSSAPAGAAAVTGLYIGLVTFLAADEEKNREPGPEVFFPAMAVFGTAAAVLASAHISGGTVFSLILFTAAGAEAVWAAYRTETGRIPVPLFIGRMLRILIVLQAAWSCLALNREPLLSLLGTAVCFCILRASAELSSRTFYGS